MTPRHDRLTKMLLCLSLICAFPRGVHAAGRPAAKSRFAALSKQIGQILKLTLDGKLLLLDRGQWVAGDDPPAGQNPAQGGVRIRIGFGRRTGVDRLFRDLGRAAGARGFSASMSNNRKLQTFSGGGMAGQLKTEGDRVQFSLREDAKPGYDLNVTDDAKGGLRIVFTNFRGDVLVVSQTAGGRLTVAQITAKATFTGSARSFPAFYRKNAAYVDDHLLPLLKSIGLRPPPGRLSPDVIRSVCSRLRRHTDDERAEFKKLLGEMDDKDFNIRQAATKALSEKAFRYWPLIEKASKESPSAEVRDRLVKVITANAAQREMEQVISSLGLLKDTGYLILLLEKVGAPDRPAVAAHLRSRTRQKLGDDPAGWKRWWTAKQGEGET